MAGGFGAVCGQANAAYPVPADSNQVFYLQRSLNANTIVYTARMHPDGTIDERDPIQVYWRRFNSDGRIKPLTLLERTQAFGVRVRPLAGRPGEFAVNLVSYRKRHAILKVEDRMPVLEAELSGQPARLISAFLDVSDAKPLPRINRVTVYGRAKANGGPVTETFGR